MNSVLNVIRKFLVSHTVWMHSTLILLLSYLMVQLSHLIIPKVYYFWVLGMTIFSFPALMFVVYRDINFKLKGHYYWLLWSIIFLAYPVTLFLIRVDIITLPFATQLVNFDIDGAYTFTTLSILFLLLELMLFWLNRKKEKLTSIISFGEISVFKIAQVSVAIFCIFAMFSNTFFYTVTQEDSGFVKIAKFIFYLIQLFTIYFSYYLYYYIHHNVLYKSVLKEKGLIPYFLGLGLTLILIVPIHNALISVFPVVQDLKLHPSGLVELFDDFNFGLATVVLIISFPMIVIVEWYKQANTVAELERQKSKTELNLLKQQINPHFFFNTLNNLYSMSLTEDKQTPETIMQLSEMMRYVIYKGKEDKVKLKDEVKYMKDYIQLQMIRVHKSVDLKVDFDMDNDDLEISPLLFIILLENAFKHGIEPAGYESTLHLKMCERNGEVTFECFNSKPEDIQNEPDGIGLNNLTKRLNIVYPDQHELIIDNNKDSYKATLTISL